MTVSGQAGPLIVYGQNPSQAGTSYTSDYNPDSGPSGVSVGMMLIDPRYGYRAPLQAGSIAAVGFYQSADYFVIDQVPSTAAAANIAALANVTSGTAMTLVSSSGAGITVSVAAVTMPQSGFTFPVGTRFIDGAPAMISFGSQGTVQVIDPRTMLSRAVSITGVSGGAGGVFLVRGNDIYGFAMTESITAAAGVATTVGLRGFKSVASVTPQFTDAHNYSVGTADVFEFPLLVAEFSEAAITWNNADIVATTGFLAAQTAALTATNGSARGTYAVQSASDGTKKLQVTIQVTPYNAASANGATSLFGQVQYAA